MMRWLAGVVAVGVLSGCGGSSDRPAATGRAVDAAVTAVVPSPVEPVALESLQQHRLRLDGGPDLMGVGRDSVWIKSDDGKVHRIDPRSNKVVADVQVAHRLCQGLGVAGDEVWACTDDGIARIDPRTNALTIRATIGRVADQGTMPVAFGHVWVLPGDGRTLYGVDTATGSADVKVPLDVRCYAAAVTAADVWLACRAAGVVLRVDPRSGRVTKRITGLEAATMITAGDAVFVAYQGGVARLDARTGRVTHATRLTTDQGMVQAAAGSLWVRSAPAFLRELDPTTLSLRREVRSAETAGGSVAVGFGSVWASVFDNTNGSVYRLRAG